MRRQSKTARRQSKMTRKKSKRSLNRRFRMNSTPLPRTPRVPNFESGYIQNKFIRHDPHLFGIMKGLNLKDIFNLTDNVILIKSSEKRIFIATFDTDLPLFDSFKKYYKELGPQENLNEFLQAAVMDLVYNVKNTAGTKATKDDAKLIDLLFRMYSFTDDNPSGLKFKDIDFVKQIIFKQTDLYNKTKEKLRNEGLLAREKRSQLANRGQNEQDFLQRLKEAEQRDNEQIARKNSTSMETTV